jgi:glucose/arabinose dehydrogenase
MSNLSCRNRRSHAGHHLFISLLVLVLAAVSPPVVSAAAPFLLRGPGVNSNDFRVTVFATNLSYPLGMARLTDGSILVGVSEGADFFGGSIGKVIRLVDADNDGIADGPGSVLYTGLPGGQTCLRKGGSLVFVTGQGSGKPITILRTGASPAAALSLVGQIDINYSVSWYHPHSALLVREIPGTTNLYHLFFQLGSQYNFDQTTASNTISSPNISGATGAILGDSIYRLTIIDRGTNVAASNLTQIATGLRNPAGFAFHPKSGDFYFEDNGIDGLSNPNEPLSADELNMIPAAQVGLAPVEFFGFPTNYIEYRTGRVIGGLGIQPLVAFQPLPNPVTGSESEGPNDIVFAPPGFPDALNGGIFVTFHGKFNAGGLANEENPLVYVDLAKTNYFHFIGNDEPNIGHLDGLLATEDSLFVADLTSNGNLSTGSGRGVIYQIKSLVLPAIRFRWVSQGVELTWSFGTLQTAQNATGPWSDVAGASPYSVVVDQSKRFFRTRR